MRREPTSEQLDLIEQLGIKLAKTNDGYEYVWKHRRFISAETAIYQVQRSIKEEAERNSLSLVCNDLSGESSMSYRDALDIATDFAELNRSLSPNCFYDESMLPWSKKLIYKALKTLVNEGTLKEEIQLFKSLGVYLANFQSGIGSKALHGVGNPQIITEILSSKRSEDDKIRLLQRHMNNNRDNACQFEEIVKLRDLEFEANKDWLF
jgi:hypothetical protein